MGGWSFGNAGGFGEALDVVTFRSCTMTPVTVLSLPICTSYKRREDPSGHRRSYPSDMFLVRDALRHCRSVIRVHWIHALRWRGPLNMILACRC